MSPIVPVNADIPDSHLLDTDLGFCLEGLTLHSVPFYMRDGETQLEKCCNFQVAYSVLEMLRNNLSLRALLLAPLAYYPSKSELVVSLP